MSSLKRLKISKEGSYYIEIDEHMVRDLEIEIGDLLQLHTEEIWIYDKKKKVCTLRGISKECYDAIAKNLAKNREPLPDT